MSNKHTTRSWIVLCLGCLLIILAAIRYYQGENDKIKMDAAIRSQELENGNRVLEQQIRDIETASKVRMAAIRSGRKVKEKSYSGK